MTDPDEHLWYYRSLSDVFIGRLPGALADELKRVVCTLEDLVKRGD